MRIRVNNLEIKNTKRLLMFIPKKDNNSGFHFTFGVYQAGTLFDIHATLPCARQESKYTSVAQIPISTLNDEVEKISERLLAGGIAAKKIRLGWLRRNDYWVVTSKYLPKKWFEVEKMYDFSTEGLKYYQEKILRLKNRMIFDPQILWNLDLSEFSDIPLFLVNGKTNRHLQYKAFDFAGKRYILALKFQNSKGKNISSQSALLCAGNGFAMMIENIMAKVNEVNTAELKRRLRLSSCDHQN